MNKLIKTEMLNINIKWKIWDSCWRLCFWCDKSHNKNNLIKKDYKEYIEVLVYINNMIEYKILWFTDDFYYNSETYIELFKKIYNIKINNFDEKIIYFNINWNNYNCLNTKIKNINFIKNKIYIHVSFKNILNIKKEVLDKWIDIAKNNNKFTFIITIQLNFDIKIENLKNFIINNINIMYKNYIYYFEYINKKYRNIEFKYVIWEKYLNKKDFLLFHFEYINNVINKCKIISYMKNSKDFNIKYLNFYELEVDENLDLFIHDSICKFKITNLKNNEIIYKSKENIYNLINYILKEKDNRKNNFICNNCFHKKLI